MKQQLTAGLRKEQIAEFIHYQQVSAAGELALLPERSAISGMLSDYAGHRGAGAKCGQSPER